MRERVQRAAGIGKDERRAVSLMFIDIEGEGRERCV